VEWLGTTLVELEIISRPNAIIQRLAPNSVAAQGMATTSVQARNECCNRLREPRERYFGKWQWLTPTAWCGELVFCLTSFFSLRWTVSYFDVSKVKLFGELFLNICRILCVWTVVSSRQCSNNYLSLHFIPSASHCCPIKFSMQGRAGVEVSAMHGTS